MTARLVSLSDVSLPLMVLTLLISCVVNLNNLFIIGAASFGSPKVRLLKAFTLTLVVRVQFSLVSVPDAPVLALVVVAAVTPAGRVALTVASAFVAPV